MQAPFQRNAGHTTEPHISKRHLWNFYPLGQIYIKQTMGCGKRYERSLTVNAKPGVPSIINDLFLFVDDKQDCLFNSCSLLRIII